MPMPNFIVVGSPKSGTTWLFKVLKNHPEIFVPPIKDLYYFDKNFANGRLWYENFFKKTDRFCAHGEISHNYLYDKTALKRIFHYRADMKIIVILRDPVERSLSHYRFMMKDGFFESFEEFKNSDHREYIIEWSKYSAYLGYLFEVFPPSNIHMMFLEDVKTHPRRETQRLFSFLKVDNLFFEESYLLPELESTDSRCKILGKFAKNLANFLRKVGLLNTLGRLKHSKSLRKLLYKPSTSIKDEKTVVAYCESELFDEYTKLQSMLPQALPFERRIEIG